MTTVTLPSGLTGELRGLTGKDGRQLSNEKIVRDGEVEDYLLRNCWGATIDPGPYTVMPSGIDWNQILIGDRASALIRIRLETYPDEPYTFPLRCPVRTCGKKFEWQLDLEEFLKKKEQKLSPEACEIYKAGNRFNVVIPGTNPPRKLWFKLQTSGDSKRFKLWVEQQKEGSRKQQERTNDLVNSLNFWGSEIEGIEKKNIEARQDFLESLGMRELNTLRQEMEKFQCGVDISIEIECPKCRTEWEVELPFTRAFVLPTKKKTTMTNAVENEVHLESQAV